MTMAAAARIDTAVARYVALAVAICLLGACARSGPGPVPSSPAPIDARAVRVSLGTGPSVALSATGAWLLIDRDGRTVARGDSGERVTLSSTTGGVRVQRGATNLTVAPPPLSMAPRRPTGFATLNGRRYRGQLAVVGADTALHVINRVDVESYLRGVVPREIGARTANERAAVEAQAVAARSYVVTRLGSNAARPFDVSATTADQVYGGVESENALANAAIDATAGLVLYYGDRVVSGQYYSTCGGSSAEPAELWRSRNEPYLQRVSDRIPGTERYYCDIAPRFRWERSWRADTLATVIERYLRSYAEAPAEPLGAVRNVVVEGRTPSGRVAVLRVDMDHGAYRVRGNDIRNVLRSPGGEPLNSTYFSPDIVADTDGRLSRLTVRGLGYGHGVGMCQWGAIGRARAGQDFRMILRTYYPGTRIARAY